MSAARVLPVPQELAQGLAVELELETDGRWIAEVPALPGVLAYGASQDEAATAALALALHVIADRLEHH